LSLSGVGAKLQRERESQGRSLDEIAAATKIPLRHLESIEAEDLDALPGLVFTRNFVRQYATTLKLDPEPLLAALPKVDHASVPLPVAPKIARSRRWDSREKSLAKAALWAVVLLGGAIVLYRELSIPAYTTTSVHASPAPPVSQSPAPGRPAAPPPVVNPDASPVQVTVTALKSSWVSLTADGKSSFAGTLEPNETKAISATEQVKLVAGNAGGVTISLNGKTLDPIGPEGQVRVVRLTAEGPQFLAKSPQPAPAPL
jgi:cytoskeleton protein RodZ